MAFRGIVKLAIQNYYEVNMLEKLAIKFISWNLRRKGINNLEVVIRSDGDALYKRNKEREENIKEVISKIK